MKFGFTVPCFGDPKDLLRLALEVEAAGWDGFFIWDHLQYRANVVEPVVDPWIVLKKR